MGPSKRKLCLNGVKSYATTDLQETISTSDGDASRAPVSHLSALFVDACNTALSSGDSAALDDLMVDTKEVRWDNQIASTFTDMKDVFKGFSDFFMDPYLMSYESRKVGNSVVEIDYQVSFWYPLPWRPRIIIPGTVSLQTNADFTKIVDIKEQWDISLSSIFFKQVLPRFWDVWHVFSSPTPEHPPMTKIGKVGKVDFVELSPTLAYEAEWLAPSKFPGPPLLVLPGFSMFGELRTTRPRRDAFLCTLPIESFSDTFMDATSTETYKRNYWRMHVPTQLHSLVREHAAASTKFPLLSMEQESGVQKEEEDDLKMESDIQVGGGSDSTAEENINVMASVKGGKQRGAEYTPNEQLVQEFINSEKLRYQYMYLPRRIMAQYSINGPVSAKDVNTAVDLITKAIQSKEAQSLLLQSRVGKGKSSVGMKMKSMSTNNKSPLVGFQMFGTKAGFNMKGEPAMAVYESQYQKQLNKVQVEVTFQ